MPFVKGQSGNPGGKPKIQREAKELARQHTAEAINRLLSIMRQQKDTKAALTAAMAVIERGWGKATQSVEMTGKDGGAIKTEMSDTEAARLIAFTLAKAMQEGAEVKIEAPTTETVQ